METPAKRGPVLKKSTRLALAIVIGVAVSSSAALAQPVITEFPLPPGPVCPHAITAGADGNLWITESCVHKIVRMTTAGVFNEFPTPTSSSQPSGITAGPGGVWFVETSANKIGFSDPGGMIPPEYSIPTASAGAEYITAGPDGNLWFTELSANNIVQMTTGGTFTEFFVGSGNPRGITAGPDGNIWFTLYTASAISRMTTLGVVTGDFTLTPGAQPAHITTGPDGNLWFTEYSGNKIGRITPAGVITEFPVPTASACPWGITAGPDGNVWFTEACVGKIGRITPAGVITEFPLLVTLSQAQGITAGPDGNIWFTENALGQIGRLELAEFHVTVTRAGSGAGSVSSSPAGLTCPSNCAALFQMVTDVTLTATASAGSVFGGWSGGGCSGTGPCVMTVNSDVGVTATFDAVAPPPGPGPTVTVTKAGNGSGTVSGPGIECGTQCSAGFSPGLTLSATAAPGSSFGGWSGPCSGTGLCVVGVSGDTTVTATFARAPSQTAADSAGANGTSANPSVSADGRLVAFDSGATNLAAACTSGRQIFLRDRVSGLTTCLSLAPDGAAGNGQSTHPSLSGDGQIVAFDSTATNLAGVCTSGGPQIFVLNRATGVITCVSAASGAPGDGASTGPVISADGRVVAFASTATNLATPCTSGAAQIYVFNRASGQLTCVSAEGGQEGSGDSGHPALSADGRYVAFHSMATNLAGFCLTGPQQIFVRDRTTGGITCESLNQAGVPGDGPSANPALDAAGNYLAYESTATNLASPCTGGVVAQIYVRDRTTGLTRCRSVDAGGAAGTGDSRTPALSGDGRRLAFVSGAPNIVSAVSLTAHGPRQVGDTDQVVGEALDAPGAVSGPSGSAPEVISTSSSGEPGSAASDAPTLSGDGSVTGFQSTAPNLAPGTNPGANVFTVQAGRARLMAPAVGSQFILDTGPTVTFSWTPLPGVSLYGFEFTGPNRQFSNPNGTVPDPVNGFGGAGGGFPLSGTSFSVPLGPGLPLGAYQVRVLGVTPGGTFSDALTIVLGAGDRPVILSPADQTALPVGSPVTFGWTPVGGAALYGFEFTGPNRTFANPNGTTPDPVNGFGGAGGAFVMPATGFSLTLPPGITPGSYQIRAIGLTSGSAPVGVFSDAVTFIIP